MNPLKIALGISLTCNIIQATAGGIVLRKMEKNDRYTEQVFDLAKYMAGIIDRNEIPLDEFDQIAFHELGLIREIPSDES